MGKSILIFSLYALTATVVAGVSGEKGNEGGHVAILLLQLAALK